MRHEDGHCDECGCQVTAAQLSIDGREICDWCRRTAIAGASTTSAKRPEARDDGR